MAGWFGGRIGRPAAVCFLAAGAAFLCAVGATRAEGAPAVTVSQAEREASFKCGFDTPENYTGLKTSPRTPVMFVTGTGFGGQESYVLGYGAFEAYGGSVCYLESPTRLLGDLQDSVQHLVHGIRRMHSLSGRKIAVLGISQGALLPRMALTYWPGLRRMVGDLVAVAGTQHGTNVGSAGACGPASPCPAAYWQQAQGSELLTNLNRYPDETPGGTSYTTVRTLSDETVRPVKRKWRRSTSALRGASNILIQDVCPTRTTTHIGSAVDSVTFAAFIDAISNRGPAKRARLLKARRAICSQQFATGLDPEATTALLGLAGGSSGPAEGTTLHTEEPAVRPGFRIKPRRR